MGFRNGPLLLMTCPFLNYHQNGNAAVLPICRNNKTPLKIVEPIKLLFITRVASCWASGTECLKQMYIRKKNDLLDH